MLFETLRVLVSRHIQAGVEYKAALVHLASFALAFVDASAEHSPEIDGHQIGAALNIMSAIAAIYR